MLKRFWNEECGAVVSAELVLAATILVIGVMAGVASLRDAAIEELADVGAGVGNLDQTIKVFGSRAHAAASAGSGYQDRVDYCDGDDWADNPRCVVIGRGEPPCEVNGPDGGG